MSTLTLVRVAFYQYRTQLWCKSEIKKISTKDRLCLALVRKSLLHGCETWQVKIGTFVSSSYSITSTSAEYLILNTAVRTHCKIGSLQQTLLTRRLRWFGHALRRQSSEFIRKAIASDSHKVGGSGVVDRRALGRLKLTLNRS